VPSHDSDARRSLTPLLMFDPRFTGVDQASAVLARVEVQMSTPPRPPERFESKKTSSPSAEIGAELWVTPGTVKKHLENVYLKLGVGSRAAAASRVQSGP
jgi:hypothetical protein